MKAHQAAKKLGMTNKEFLKDSGLKHHMNEVPEEVVAKYFGEEKKIPTKPQATETANSAETIVVGGEDGSRPEADKPEQDDCPYSLKEIELSIRCLGSKSKQWKWRHLLNG